MDRSRQLDSHSDDMLEYCCNLSMQTELSYLVLRHQVTSGYYRRRFHSRRHLVSQLLLHEQRASCPIELLLGGLQTDLHRLVIPRSRHPTAPWSWWMGGMAMALCFGRWTDCTYWNLFMVRQLTVYSISQLSKVDRFWLPASPTQTKGRLRGKEGWFNEREEIIMVNRILRDDPGKGGMHNR